MIFHHNMIWFLILGVMLWVLSLGLEFFSSPLPLLVRHSPHKREYHEEIKLFEYWDAFQSQSTDKHDFPGMMDGIEILLEQQNLHTIKKTISNHGSSWTLTLSLQGGLLELLGFLEGIESHGFSLEQSAVNLRQKEDLFALSLILHVPLIPPENNGDQSTLLDELTAAIEGRLQNQIAMATNRQKRESYSMILDLFAAIPSKETQGETLPLPAGIASPKNHPHHVLSSPFTIIGICSLDSQDGLILIQNSQTGEIHSVEGKTVETLFNAPSSLVLEFFFQDEFYALEWAP